MPSLREAQERLREAAVARSAHADAGLEIYRHAYGARLAQALRSNYPVLAQRVGSEAFARLARRYLDLYPSRHFNIRWHGAHLWRLLDGAMADLARMEWALGIAFDARDARPLDRAALESTPLAAWGEMPLGLHPSTQVLPMSWNAGKIWEGAEEPRRHDHALIVWRKGLQAHWRSATSAEGAALRALRLGSLSAACLAVPEADADDVGAWFAGWVSEGLLVATGPA